MRPTQERRKHLTRGIHIVINRLLAAQNQTGTFGSHHSRQQFGDGEGFDVGLNGGGRLNQDSAVGTHRQRSVQSFLRLFDADRVDDDLGRDALFLQSDRRLGRFRRSQDRQSRSNLLFLRKSGGKTGSHFSQICFRRQFRAMGSSTS